jgi:hypothetical protein
MHAPRIAMRLGNHLQSRFHLSLRSYRNMHRVTGRSDAP